MKEFYSHNLQEKSQDALFKAASQDDRRALDILVDNIVYHLPSWDGQKWRYRRDREKHNQWVFLPPALAGESIRRRVAEELRADLVYAVRAALERAIEKGLPWRSHVKTCLKKEVYWQEGNIYRKVLPARSTAKRHKKKGTPLEPMQGRSYEYAAPTPEFCPRSNKTPRFASLNELCRDPSPNDGDEGAVDHRVRDPHRIDRANQILTAIRWFVASEAEVELLDDLLEVRVSIAALTRKTGLTYRQIRSTLDSIRDRSLKVGIEPDYIEPGYQIEFYDDDEYE